MTQKKKFVLMMIGIPPIQLEPLPSSGSGSEGRVLASSRKTGIIQLFMNVNLMLQSTAKHGGDISPSKRG